MKRLENIDIKNLITMTALVLWVGFSVFGCIKGEFGTTFEYFKTCFSTVIAFFLGTKVAKSEAEAEEPEEAEEYDE